MKKNTLKKRLISLIALTFVIIAMITTATILGYSYFKKNANTAAIKAKLSSNISSQVNSLLISFLVVEQKSGAKILLEQFKNQEELSHSFLIENEKMPDEFSSCDLFNTPTFCTSKDGNFLAVMTPIKNQNKIYAYLLKAKSIENEELDSTIFSLLVSCMFVLFLAFVVLFLGIAKITS